jgi:hypothetical protein
MATISQPPASQPSAKYDSNWALLVFLGSNLGLLPVFAALIYTHLSF